MGEVGDGRGGVSYKVCEDSPAKEDHVSSSRGIFDADFEFLYIEKMVSV